MTDASADARHRTKEIEALVLFDGACNLCNGAVQFIIARDPGGYFKFAPLQSGIGQRTLADHQLPDADSAQATMVLVEQGRAVFRSEAALRIARHLGSGPWQRRLWRVAAAVGLAVPAPVRELVYRWVAKNRRRWFGTSSCWVPTPELRDRFLQLPATGEQ